MKNMKKRDLLKNNTKQGSIRNKILKSNISIVVISLLLTGIMSVLLNYSSTFNALKQTMAETVKLASAQVNSDIKARQDILFASTLNPAVTSNSTSVSEKETCLEAVAAAYSFDYIDITDAHGESLLTGTDFSGTDAFTAVKNGEYYISDPIRSDDGTSMYLRLAVPVKQNNTFSGMLYGDTDASFISDMLTQINIGQTGNAAILDNKGNTIGFADYQLVLDQYNTQKEAETDKALKDLAAIEKAMTEGKTGYGQYYYGGANKFMSYTPIAGTNGWSIDVSIVRNEFLSGTVMSLILTILIVAAVILISSLLLVRLSRSIVTPIRQCVDRLTKVAMGDLHSPVPVIDTGDETQVLSETTSSLITGLKEMMADLIRILERMADKDFNVESSFQYAGDFVPLQTSIQEIIVNLNSVFGNIFGVTEHLSVGAEEISKVSMTLSEGASEQAGTIEELTASVTDISEKVTQTAESAKKANDLSASVTSKANYSNQQMTKMSDAMGQISASSEKISEIIKTIDSIASQTNLLSLNASIEAARAGEMGKGFAVVANEIRQLAEQSAGAVKDTTKLIQDSLQAVENGSMTVEETAESLKQILDVIEQSDAAVSAITQDTDHQSEAISQITIALDQISETVQSNSAIAQESAASSEQLDNEAHVLKGMLDQFTFKHGNQ